MTLPPAETWSHLFCLTGIDGCGKSTHIRRLGATIAADDGRDPATISVWEIAKNPRYHQHPFISDRAMVHRYLSLLHNGPRAMFVFHGLLESLELARETGAHQILANGYWHKYAFTEHLMGEPWPWLEILCHRFPRPRATVFLDVHPDIAWKRKTQVTPYECGFQAPSRETFIAFQTRLRDLFRQQADRDGWFIVDVNRPEDTVADEIAAIFHREVPAHGC